MNYRYLGRSGSSVSELCLGTMTFGREADEAESRGMLDLFAEAGGNFIDTANVYGGGLETVGHGNGRSEEIIGRWLEGRRREDFVVATKVFAPMGRGPNDRGLERQHVLRAVEESLERLGTDYIDLYQVHGWDPATPLEESLATLDSLVGHGLVRYVGVSNFSGWQLQKALDLQRERGWEPFVSLQAQYSLLSRTTEWELSEICREEGLALTSWSPLRGGWLTGKFRRGADGPPEGSRADRQSISDSWAGLNNEHTWRTVDALLEVAERLQRPPAQVALRWLMQRAGVSVFPIVGARSVQQLDDNLGAAGWALGEDDLRVLDEASEVPPPYPYDILRRLGTTRVEGAVSQVS